MALTLATVLRDDIANQIDDSINVSGPGTLELETSGDVEVATFTFSNPAFGTSATGVLTMASAPKNDTSATGGVIAQFSIYDGASQKQLEGVVLTAGGDININHLTITATDNVELTSLTITVPA